MGIWPASPVFKTAEMRPQFGNIQNLFLVAHTPQRAVTLGINPYEVTITSSTKTTVRLLTGENDVQPGVKNRFERSNFP